MFMSQFIQFWLPLLTTIFRLLLGAKLNMPLLSNGELVLFKSLQLYHVPPELQPSNAKQIFLEQEDNSDLISFRYFTNSLIGGSAIESGRSNHLPVGPQAPGKRVSAQAQVYHESF